MIFPFLNCSKPRNIKYMILGTSILDVYVLDMILHVNDVLESTSCPDIQQSKIFASYTIVSILFYQQSYFY